jgi:uncharacterized membrane protein YebE (DUF533 family)
MATTETRFNRDRMTMTEAKTTSERSESLADQVLAFAAMAGAMGGALAGTVLGAEVGTAFPVACGTLGTMLGSGSAAGVWYLLARLWTGLVVGGHTGRERAHAAQFGAVTSAPSQG